MKKVFLSNGMTLILEKTKSNSITLGVCVKTGSNNEGKNNKGVSHFIEHMLFEGTKKRTAQEIVREIEGVGGEFNAFTDHEITFFYTKLLSKYFDKALNVISDIILNSVFDEETIEKERKVILEEINLWEDDPKNYQWQLFQKVLYKKNPTKYPVIGFKETLQKLKRKDIISYYKKYYLPNNMIIVVTGDFNPDIKNKIENAFKDFKQGKIKNKKIVKEPLQKSLIKYKEKKQVSHSYLVIGYKTVNRDNKNSYVLDLISVILGIGQSSRLFNEIRTKRGLSYNLGANHDCNKTFGYFGIFVSAEKKNIGLCKELILKELKLENLSIKEIEDSKKMIEGLFLLKNEDTRDLAGSLSHWEFFSDSKDFYDYTKRIKKITKNDILNVAKKYFTKNYTEVLIGK